jgi:6-phosphogluconolactonase (cycloisomerase 2 family)
VYRPDQDRGDTIAQVGRVSIPGQPDEIAVMQADSVRQLLYVGVIAGDSALASFSINAVGAPTFKDRIPSANPGELSLAVHPAGQYVYAALDEEALGFKVERGMFSLINGFSELLPGDISAMAIDMSGSYLFVSTSENPITGQGVNEVVSHAIDPATGLVTVLNTQPADIEVSSLATTHSGSYLYAVSGLDGKIYRYGVDGGGRLSRGAVAADTLASGCTEIMIVEQP